MTAHLHSGARVFEQILREIHPEYDWVVTVKECGCERCTAFADPGAASASGDEAGAARRMRTSDPS
jgi:hypothetical protein